MNHPSISSQHSLVDISSNLVVVPVLDVSADSVLNNIDPMPYQQSPHASEKEFFEINLNDEMREPSDSDFLLNAESIEVKNNNPRARANWAKALSSVRQLVKGAFPDCLVIKEYYYPEALDSRHEYASVQKEYFEAWEDIAVAGDDATGNYFKFLELYRRPIVDSDISDDGRLMIEDTHSYVTDHHGHILNQGLLDKSWVFTGRDEEFQVAIGVCQFSPKESWERFGTFITPNKMVLSPQHHYKTDLANSMVPMEFIFVSDKDQFIYTGLKVKGFFHHSSFLSGQPVAMAGTLAISPSGQLLHVSNASGHYQPGAVQCAQFLSNLERKGVNLSQLKFSFWDHHMELAFDGCASDWLGQYQHDQ